MQNWLCLFRPALIDHQAGKFNLVFRNQSQSADFLAHLECLFELRPCTGEVSRGLKRLTINDHGGGTVLIGAIGSWVSVDGLLRQQTGFLNSALGQP